ncbi:MAG: hypothetical protein ARM1_0276 [Candidatus Micrarchaeota archaeon]|nr:MAG: hypothetical protein ARM1_0276 [Candidatus Micrarchaeota archaeon]
MFSSILAILIASISIVLPGVLISFALLKSTPFNTIEKLLMGIILGVIALPTLLWLESYLISYIHFFSFSLALADLDTVVLIALGLVLCYINNVFSDFKRFIKSLKIDSNSVIKYIKTDYAYIILIILMLLAFYIRVVNINVSQTFFEFDPYFDMMDTRYILTYGYQLLNDTSAWPIAPNGTNHRIQPIVPYLEAYFYTLYNDTVTHYSYLNNTLVSRVSSIYPPLTAALLVFVVFLLISKNYGNDVALFGSALAAFNQLLITTFVAGEQLLEPWGIFSLFFFIAVYMIAVKDMKNKRLAILSGIAFASTFLGAHYYTVDAGILALYILLQGIIFFIKDKHALKDFYIFNVIVIAVISVFLALYHPYHATLSGRIPSVFHIPITVGFAILALIAVIGLQIIERVIKSISYFSKKSSSFRDMATIGIFIILAFVFVIATPLRHTVVSYLSLSKKFTTPSTPLFMTVAEFQPSGINFNFGGNGFGLIGSLLYSSTLMPLFVYIVIASTIIFLVLDILHNADRSAILYLAASLPLIFAGFSEVKYLPHFDIAFIILLSVFLGEILRIVKHYYREVIMIIFASLALSILAFNITLISVYINLILSISSSLTYLFTNSAIAIVISIIMLSIIGYQIYSSKHGIKGSLKISIVAYIILSIASAFLTTTEIVTFTNGGAIGYGGLTFIFLILIFSLAISLTFYKFRNIKEVSISDKEIMKHKESRFIYEVFLFFISPILTLILLIREYYIYSRESSKSPTAAIDKTTS